MHKRLLIAVSLSACATSSAPPTPTPVDAQTLSAPLGTFFESPFWFGRSDHSPFGPMPYGLTARRDGERLILRGDVPDGLGMPPGSYQEFTFTPGPKTELRFETSLSGQLVTGTMHEVARTPDSLTFCMAPAETGGGCDEMTVSFTRVEQGILFETKRERGPHHRVTLVATRP
ncbi:MAG TPA: hypothetical protein PK095_18125 [Myxococcota bacterium]|nr:hypothetical protein [Myxococcota bacterium]